MLGRPRGIGARVQELLLAGWTNRKIRRETGCGSATVSYHAKKLGISASSRPTYDWSAVAAEIMNGATFPDCERMFGCKISSFYRAVRNGLIPKPLAKRSKAWISPEQLSEVLMGKSGRGPRWRMKSKLLKEGVFEPHCSICLLEKWLGQRLPLRLDHIDGNGTNFALSNLRLLCGNCDSLQDTFCHKNVKAGVAKPVDAVDLKSTAQKRAGANPVARTKAPVVEQKTRLI